MSTQNVSRLLLVLLVCCAAPHSFGEGKSDIKVTRNAKQKTKFEMTVQQLEDKLRNDDPDEPEPNDPVDTRQFEVSAPARIAADSKDSSWLSWIARTGLNIGWESVKKVFLSNFVEKLVNIALDPIRKTVQVNFNIWFDKNFPPSEYQLARRADKDGRKIDELLFNPDVHIQVRAFADQLKEASQNNAKLPTLLLYGPPGTGKTEIVKRLANEGNFEVVIFSAGELRKPAYSFDDSGSDKRLLQIFNYASRKKNTSTIARFCNWFIDSASNSSEKIIIFVDEGEELLAATDGYQRSHELQAFLTATGTGSPNYSVVFATNFLAKIDRAAYQRFTFRIDVGLPDAERRLGIVLSFLQRFKERYPEIVIDEQLLREESHFDSFAKASEGLAGRELERVANMIAVDAHLSGKHNISPTSMLRYVNKEKEDRDRLEEERLKEAERRAQERRDRIREYEMSKEADKKASKK